MLNRLETMVLMGTDMPLSAIRGQIASGIDIIVHLGRLRDKSRKVLEIVEVMNYEDMEIKTSTLYKFEEDDNMEKNELTLFNGQGNRTYCSKVVEKEEDKKDLFNALETCDALLNDCVGQEINIKDVYCEERGKYVYFTGMKFNDLKEAKYLDDYEFIEKQGRKKCTLCTISL